jgi:catechol-2,3-dioxygenase
MPVSDVMASTDWYAEVLGLSAILMEEEETQVTGTVLLTGDEPSVGLHLDPVRASALAGFCVMAIDVGASQALSQWKAWLTRSEIAHSGIVDGPLGQYIALSDPDGLIVQLHTREHPSMEEA